MFCGVDKLECIASGHPECKNTMSGMCHCGTYGLRRVNEDDQDATWGLMSEAWYKQL